MKTLPDRDYLRTILDYCPATGVLMWKTRPVSMFKGSPPSRAAGTWNTRFAGKLALPSLTQHGYYHGAIDGINYKAHRVIWKWMTGEDPAEIDHINGVRADNRWSNLRSVNRGENMRNLRPPVTNTSGVVGVYFNKQIAKWIAQIQFEGRVRVIGNFLVFSEAAKARRDAEKELGFHPNHGLSSEAVNAADMWLQVRSDQ